MSDFLTLEEQEEIDTLLGVMRHIPESELEGVYKGLREGRTGNLLVDEQLGFCRLSKHTRKLEEARQLKLAQKKRSLRHRKPLDKRKAPWTQKQHSERKRLARDWARNPWWCVLKRDSRKVKLLPKGLWHEKLDQVWEKYDPAGLTVSFPRTAGTYKEPWSLYNMTVVWDDPSLSIYLRKKGRARPIVVYHGPDELIYDLSAGREVHLTVEDKRVKP